MRVDFVERLARKWSGYVATMTPEQMCAAAIREALEVAEGIAKKHIGHLGVDHAPTKPLHRMLEDGGRGCAEEITTAIAALRGRKESHDAR